MNWLAMYPNTNGREDCNSCSLVQGNKKEEIADLMKRKDG
jgi:hypothetical protein